MWQFALAVVAFVVAVPLALLLLLLLLLPFAVCAVGLTYCHH